jgi:hypothetical protein
VGTVADNKTLKQLPLSKRNFMELIQLDAGAQRPAGAFNSVFNMFGGHANSYGSPADGSRFTLDGVDFKGVAYSRIEIRPSAEAIQEFKQQGATASSEFGLNSGMQVNLVTKSGTNELHGSLYEYFQNSDMNARNFFDGKNVAPYHFNQFGGSIGGPIRKNKTFYFVNYEGSREVSSSTRLVSVPPAAMRTGNFSALPQQIFDPSSLNTSGLRQPFPGNLIPASRLDPVAQNVLYGTGQQQALFPTPNMAGISNNLLATEPSTQNEDQVNARLDQRFSDSDTVFGRYTLHNQRRVLQFNRYLEQLPNFSDRWDTPSQNARIGWTRVIGARMVNEFKLGYMRMTQVLGDIQMGTPVDQRLGITGTSPIFLFNPTIAITGFNSTGPLSNAPNNRTENTYLIGDTFSYTVGTHNLGFGGDVRQRQQNGGAQFFAAGQFSFTPRFTTQPGMAGSGFALADFVLGYPTSTQTSHEDGFANLKQNNYGLYVKDDWKLTSRLTLNLGLRWEYSSPWTEARDRIANFDPASGQLVVQGPNSPFGRGIVKPDYHDFGPRFGFAWRPFADDKTVLRGGYAIGYSPFDAFLVSSNFRTNRPFVNRLSFLSDALVPNLTLGNGFPAALGTVSLAASGIDRNWRDGYNQQFSFTAERVLASNLVLEVGYIGNKGTHLKALGLQLNGAPPGPGAVQARRPYPAYTGISWNQSSGSSIYHGLRTNLRRRFANGFTGNFSYVWSKGLDAAGNAFYADSVDNLRRNQFNSKAERGRSIFDNRQSVAASFVYAIPLLRGNRSLAGKTLGDWEISSIIAFSSGGPADVVLATDNSNTGNFLDRPDLIGTPNNGPRNAQKWFNTAAFAQPAPYSYGNAGRNIIDGPGYGEVDLSLLKNIPLWEKKRLQFRAEFFNIINRPNFDLPNTTFGTGSFGTIGFAGDGRRIQFALRLEF